MFPAGVENFSGVGRLHARRHAPLNGLRNSSHIRSAEAGARSPGASRPRGGSDYFAVSEPGVREDDVAMR